MEGDERFDNASGVQGIEFDEYTQDSEGFFNAQPDFKNYSVADRVEHIYDSAWVAVKDKGNLALQQGKAARAANLYLRCCPLFHAASISHIFHFISPAYAHSPLSP